MRTFAALLIALAASVDPAPFTDPQSGVWGVADAFRNDYRPDATVQSWRRLVNTTYEGLRPTIKLEDPDEPREVRHADQEGKGAEGPLEILSRARRLQTTGSRALRGSATALREAPRRDGRFSRHTRARGRSGRCIREWVHKPAELQQNP